MIKKRHDYLKIVEWSEEDQCYVGTAPGLIIGGIHGKDQRHVFNELCDAVDESVSLLEAEGRPIPTQAIKEKYSGKIALRVSPAGICAVEVIASLEYK